jgi:hypothetical protein
MAIKYHANFHSESYRSSRPANAVAFYAANDGAAAAVAAELGNWTTGRLTSLTKNIGGDGTAGPYPTGTRRTCFAQASTADGRVHKIRFRNVNAGVSEDDIVALLTGVAGTGGIGAGFVILGAPPKIPGTTNDITGVAAVTFVNKS